MCRCPSKSCITRMSTPRSSRWVAKQWRKVWTVTVLPRPAASAVARQARCNERRRDRLVRVKAGEEPSLRPFGAPVGTQDSEQLLLVDGGECSPVLQIGDGAEEADDLFGRQYRRQLVGPPGKRKLRLGFRLAQ